MAAVGCTASSLGRSAAWGAGNASDPGDLTATQRTRAMRKARQSVAIATGEARLQAAYQQITTLEGQVADRTAVLAAVCTELGADPRVVGRLCAIAPCLAAQVAADDVGGPAASSRGLVSADAHVLGNAAKHQFSLKMPFNRLTAHRARQLQRGGARAFRHDCSRSTACGASDSEERGGSAASVASGASDGVSAVYRDVTGVNEFFGISTCDAAVQADGSDRGELPCDEGALRQVEDTAVEACRVARELLDVFEHAALLEFAGGFQCWPVGAPTFCWQPKAGLAQHDVIGAMEKQPKDAGTEAAAPKAAGCAAERKPDGQAAERDDVGVHAALLEFVGGFPCRPVGEPSLLWRPKSGLLQLPLCAVGVSVVEVGVARDRISSATSRRLSTQTRVTAKGGLCGADEDQVVWHGLLRGLCAAYLDPARRDDATLWGNCRFQGYR